MSRITDNPYPHIRRTRGMALAACAAVLLACCATACSAASGLRGSEDPGCVAALKAVSTYGGPAISDIVHGKEAADRVKLDLFVDALDAAADLAGQASDKHAIESLANDYGDYRDDVNDITVKPVADLVGDTSALDTVCAA